MDIFSYLFSSDFIDTAARVVTLASVVTAVTPTPKDDNVLGKAYKIIETLALVVGKAKDKGGR